MRILRVNLVFALLGLCACVQASSRVMSLESIITDSLGRPPLQTRLQKIESDLYRAKHRCFLCVSWPDQEEIEGLTNALKKEVLSMHKKGELSARYQETYASYLLDYTTEHLEEWEKDPFKERYSSFTSQLETLAEEGDDRARTLITHMLLSYIQDKEKTEDLGPTYNIFLKSLRKPTGLPSWINTKGDTDLKDYVLWCNHNTGDFFPGCFANWKNQAKAKK